MKPFWRKKSYEFRNKKVGREKALLYSAQFKDSLEFHLKGETDVRERGTTSEEVGNDNGDGRGNRTPDTGLHGDAGVEPKETV